MIFSGALACFLRWLAFQKVLVLVLRLHDDSLLCSIAVDGEYHKKSIGLQQK